MRSPLVTGALGAGMVAVAGLVTSPLPPSSWVAELAVLSDLRDSMPGRMAALAVVVTGLGLLGLAWLRTLRQLSLGDQATALRLAVLHRSALVWSLPLLLAPPLFSRDGWSYAAQGALVAEGVTPYTWGPALLSGPISEAVDLRWARTPAPYGPLPLAWGGMAADITMDPWLLVVAHRLLALVGLALLAAAVPRLARWAGKDPVLATWLVLPSPFMLAHGVGGLHNDLLMVGLMAAALVVAVEHGWPAGAVLGGLAAAVKVPGGLVCIAVVLVSLPAGTALAGRVRRTAAVAAVSVGTLLALGVLTGLGAGWVHALGVPGEVRTPLSVSTQLGRVLELLLHLVGLDDAASAAVPLVRLVGSLALVLLAALLVLRGPTGSPARATRSFALLMLAAVLLSPVVHHWYVLWCVPFLAAIHLGRRATTALVVATILLGVSGPLDSSLQGAWVHVGLTAALAVAVAAALLGYLRFRLPEDETARTGSSALAYAPAHGHHRS